MATTSYHLMQWYGKWIVVKSFPLSVRKWYLKGVRNGCEKWCCDPLYAQAYSEKTAHRHLRNLRANDPSCEEDY